MGFQMERDTAANLTSADATYEAGRPVYETDTGRMKIGDGSTAWTSLGYVDPAAASATLAGIVELATAAETTTGTDTGRAVTPDGLAGSAYGQEVVTVCLFDGSEDVATGDGAGDQLLRIPAKINGWNLVGVAAYHQTAGTGAGSDTTDIQIHNVTSAADMLSTVLTIDEDETDSAAAGTTPAVIDAAEDDVATGDKLRFDVDDVVTSDAPKGLWVEMTFQAA